MGSKTSKSKTNDQAMICKLKLDHYEKLFDWLSLEDILMLGQTCNRMKRIVGQYIKTHYAGAPIECYIYEIELRCLLDNPIKLNWLIPFVKKLEFYQLEEKKGKFGKIKYIRHMKANQYKSLTEIHLRGTHPLRRGEWTAMDSFILTTKGISRMKEILGRLETIRLDSPCFCIEKNQDFYESFLQFCTNLKKLYILVAMEDKPTHAYAGGTRLIGVDNRWLLRRYPTLEHFELTVQFSASTNFEIDELRTFFDQNTRIKTFATNVEIILANSDTFKSTTAKWDVLSILFEHKEKFNSSRDLLNDLRERSLFKESHFYFHECFEFDHEMINQLISVNDSTTLFVQKCECSIDLSPLNNLKHLFVIFPDKHMKAMAKSLVNLEFIQFKSADVIDLIPFIRYLPKLTTIIVFCTRRSDAYKIINTTPTLAELNEERSKLTNARKLTVYVEERIYLAMRWTNINTNQSFIEIKRCESFDPMNCYNFFWVGENYQYRFW